MACGECARRRAAREAAAAAAKKEKEGAAAVSTATAGEAPKKAAKVKAGTPGVCMKMYDELVLLDRKVIALHKKFKWTQEGYKLMQAQRVIRQWIQELPKGCPDSGDLQDAKEYINPMYAQYFSINGESKLS